MVHEDMKTSEQVILDLGAILSAQQIHNGIIYFGDTNGAFYAVQLMAQP